MIINKIQNNFYPAIWVGIILQCAGRLIIPVHNNLVLAILGWLVTIIGTLLVLFGFAFYAKSKGRNQAWCLLALLSVIGWIILICLKDKSADAFVKGKE